MHRTPGPALPRVVVNWTLVVALLAAGVTGWMALPARPLPAPLVGVWHGGDHTNGPWSYAISADGAYRTWPDADPRAVATGAVTVDGDQVTFSNGGAPVTATWSASDDVLLLDGQRYVRRRS